MCNVISVVGARHYGENARAHFATSCYKLSMRRIKTL